MPKAKINHIGVEDLQKVILDLLDNNFRWQEIIEQTGLTEDRCRDIQTLFFTLVNGETGPDIPWSRSRLKDEKGPL